MSRVDLIAGVEVDGSRVVVRANELALGGVMREPFWVEYEPDVDVAAWPLTWQTAPFMLNVAPIVWALGAEVRVEAMDAALAASLDDLRRRFGTELYPGLAWSGSIRADSLVEASRRSPSDEVGVLFSGGLDSVSTAMRHLGERQRLLTIRGADVSNDDEAGWSYVVDHVREFASEYGQSVSLVRSNLRSFYDDWRLSRLDASISDWWSNVQHGMGLIGVVAPLLGSFGIDRVYIAASHTATFKVPWGSSPAIDETIRFADLHVVHDGYELSRQDKLRGVLEVAAANEIAVPRLRVCYANPDGGGTNCGRCEKCLRTVAGALIEGGDLERLGFPKPAGGYLALIARKFRRHTMPANENVAWMWGDIKSRANVLLTAGQESPSSAALELSTWLAGFDFDAYAKRYAKVKRVRKAAQNLLRRSPALFRLARRVAIKVEDR